MITGGYIDLLAYVVRILGTPFSVVPHHVYIYAHQPTACSFAAMFACLKGYTNRNIYILDSTPGLSGYMGYEWTQQLAKTHECDILPDGSGCQRAAGTDRV